jgi:hypothetical protein
VDANDTRETDIPIFKVLFCLPTARWLPVASESFGTFRWQLYDEVTSIPSASGEGAMYPHRPKHYLVWCSGLVVIGGEADIARKPQIGVLDPKRSSRRLSNLRCNKRLNASFDHSARGRPNARPA